MKKAYLSIAIANNPNWRKQLEEMEKRYEKEYIIMSPGETKSKLDYQYSFTEAVPREIDYLVQGLMNLRYCDIIVMHESCKRLNSKGAEIERLMAEYGGIEVVWE